MSQFTSVMEGVDGVEQYGQIDIKTLEDEIPTMYYYDRYGHHCVEQPCIDIYESESDVESALNTLID